MAGELRKLSKPNKRDKKKSNDFHKKSLCLPERCPIKMNFVHLGRATGSVQVTLNNRKYISIN